MGLKFSIPYQIPFYETDITHHVKLPHLLAFSLQVSGMQSESLGNTAASRCQAANCEGT